MKSKTRHEMYEFEVERDRDGRVAAFKITAIGLEGKVRKTRLNGYRAHPVARSLHDLLQDYGITGRQWAGSRPIVLDHTDAGPHGELLLRAVKPVRRSDHISTIAQVIADMSREEALYWCAKSAKPYGLRALRLICYGVHR